MKILFISMPSVHVIRWIENLKDAKHELFWYDILGRGKLETLESVNQFVKIAKRKIPYIKGEYFLSKRVPYLYHSIRPFLENTENEILENIIKNINPDVIHSFEMQSCSYPIIKTMNKFPDIKWVYSCWGNDLFYYQNFKKHKDKIKSVLARVDYLHTDCFRDYKIATELGFKGKHVGVIPGGTGYNLQQLERYKLPLEQRKIILIKGYQNVFGRGLNIIKALEGLKVELDRYDIVVFGAHKEVERYIVERKLGYEVFARHDLKHQEVLKLMGKSILYIGNNISDGMANTLLEAIVMGTFPIQSNPGKVSEEIIKHGVNGFLIDDSENSDEIALLIIQAIQNKEMLINANKLNAEIAIEKLSYDSNQKKIIAVYEDLERNLSCE